MNKFKYVCAAALAVTSFGSVTDAALLLSDNFDGYANQAAFLSAWPQVGATASGTLSATQSSSAPNSVNYATTAQRNERAFAESGDASAGNIIEFAFDFYDSDAALAPYRQYANLQDSPASASGQLVSMGLNNNLASTADGGNYYMARILGGDGGTGVSGYFKLNDPGAPLRSTGWHNLKVQISDTEFKFFVDDIPAQTVANTLTARSYDMVRLGSGLTSTAEAYFDNVTVSTIVPEPTSLAMLGLAGLALGRRRRA